MLNGDVEILDDLVVRGQLVDKLVVKLVGVQVVQPYPLDAVYLRKLAAQAGKTALTVDIRAVAGDVLRDDDKLLDPVLRKLRRLVDDVLNRP